MDAVASNTSYRRREPNNAQTRDGNNRRETIANNPALAARPRRDKGNVPLAEKSPVPHAVKRRGRPRRSRVENAAKREPMERTLPHPARCSWSDGKPVDVRNDAEHSELSHDGHQDITREAELRRPTAVRSGVLLGANKRITKMNFATGVRKEASAACQLRRPVSPEPSSTNRSRLCGRSNGESGQHGCNPDPIVAHEGDSPVAPNVRDELPRIKNHE